MAVEFPPARRHLRPDSAMSALLERIGRTIRQHELFRTGDTVIVAVSGGADSCLLLELLARLPDPAPRLVVAHLNHCLRGSQSDADEEFAHTLADAHGLPYESRCVDVKACATRNGMNLEDAGRRERIRFLEAVRDKWQATAVALAHHADDQAETILMRLLRGSGSRGLSGMRLRNGRGFIRPLLQVTRQEIESCLREAGLTWREDASNRDITFLRNRIRHELLPHLATYNPAVRERLSVTAELLAADDDLLESIARDEYIRRAQRNHESVSFSATELAQQHPAMLRRLIRLGFAELSGDLRHLSQEHVSHVAGLLRDGPPNRSIDLPGLMAARREYGHLVLHRLNVNPDSPRKLLIHGPGTYELWNGMTLEISRAEHREVVKSSLDTAWFDPTKAPFPWLVRTFRPGDRMVPFGMQGSKKVKDIFIDAKVPLPRRRDIPLIFSNNILIWVCGMRASNLTRIDGASAGATKAMVRISSTATFA